MPNHSQTEVDTYLELVLNHIAEAVQVVNFEGITIYYNKLAAEMDDFQVSDVLGKHIMQVYPSLTLETSSFMTVLKTGKPLLDLQQTIVTSTGKIVNIICSTFPLYRNGVLVGACDISQDITKIKELSDRVINLHSELLDTRIRERQKIKLVAPEGLARYTFNDLIGSHDSMIKLKILGQRIAVNSSSVLVAGETGTGKELVVQSIHNASARKNEPFVAQNCAAFPVTLLESILFGTVKGSFTGAEDRPGLFELAHGGTLFLDEINSMPMELQSKLLRVLQDGTLRRIGDNKVRQVDTRIITCMNMNPEDAVRNKELRIDLYYRLNVVSLTVPPLRERKSDIPALANYFISMYNRKLCCRVSGISEEVKQTFYKHLWPGNVRELQHAIEHAMNIISGQIIELEHLPSHLRQKNDPKISGDNQVILGEHSLPEILNNVEKRCLNQAMEQCKNNISKTAILLGIPRQTLQYKLKMYDLSSNYSMPKNRQGIMGAE
ncbi:sigma-54-dependent Fis family transcriptional regulator [Desulfosporosinus sp. BICA1-9]|uniref:sigma-54 interaction domain-containing protein n=1 Tax=Desulfosporosinus sp. BICA1-9 TaxID=1531958 RepID=UPI0005F1C789|nr:sigma 54-interacting transcriptional regulator [Desulfosporosinus sp. BICA1-9]KJS49426.1 MAG: ATPase AAA [Peptococcaceae bacterium BRH_c23]KJS79993.1 MAG: ATPase AAA [Desulfosporosinus sp. BICA1-9]HBW33990.1 PAS domain S-box protein [Desulfosporosinus sp.]